MRTPREPLLINAVAYRRGPRPRRAGQVTIDAHARRTIDTLFFIRGRGRRKAQADDIIVKPMLDLVVDNRRHRGAS